MLKPKIEHRWNLTSQEAVSLQRELAGKVIPYGLHGAATVAGVDVSVRRGVVGAAVVVLALAHLQVVDRAYATRPVAYPYVPGLLSFREAPAILDALARLGSTPDVLMFDGQGWAHPRRMGLATHIGVLLDHPSIGCAKSRLCGTYEEPAEERGQFTYLYDGEEIIGAVVRTRTRVKPVFVSVGHRISLESAIRTVIDCGNGYRLPEPTRWAHRLAADAAHPPEMRQAETSTAMEDSR